MTISDFLLKLSIFLRFPIGSRNTPLKARYIKDDRKAFKGDWENVGKDIAKVLNQNK